MTGSPTPAVTNDEIVGRYDRVATVYDWFVSPLEAGTRRRALEMLDLRGGERVVEVGCGPGHALSVLADRVSPGGEVVGVDAAPGMVRRARRHVGSPAHAHVGVLLGDARSLPLCDGVADVVFVEDTLELFAAEEMATVLGELRRILDTDGQLCVITMERRYAEETLFVRTYDFLFEHAPGYDRFGCRPVYAVDALETGGFEIDRRERRRRMHVWPVDILVASPEQS